MSDVVQKLWGFCHTLRHDGIDYGDYIEQITFLLFLKMAHEREIDLRRLQYTASGGKKVTADCSWPTLAKASGTALTNHYVDTLRVLGQQPGMLGEIYTEAQSRFNNPVNLKRLINLIDETHWTELGVDVKAAVYEGLLEKAASEGKKGAGQYFTPRVLIQSIVRCMKPDPRMQPEFVLCDPACGTGGFLVAAYEWLLKQTKGGALDRAVAKRVRTKTYFGQELVARPRRLALMNLYLHGIEPTIVLGDTIYEVPASQRFDVILTNPPFGTKGANQAPEREDFTILTSNKQLNFLQHVVTTLKPGGRAAVVLPDNCLFADQAGEVMKVLTEDCNLHTVLRLPRGTFTPYSQGVKLTQDWRDRLRRSQSDSEELPVGWKTCSFEAVIAELRNGVSPRPNLNPPGLPVLRISAVRPGVVNLSDTRYLEHGSEWLKVFSLRDGDLLFTRYNGSLELLGVCGVVRGLSDRSIVYPDKLMRVRLRPDALPDYICFFFSSPAARRALISEAKSSAGQQGISGKDLKTQEIVLPPIDEQREIIRRVQGLLTLVVAIERRVAAATAHADKLTQSILAKALTGGLVVAEAELARAEDREYEPAEQLLQRVGAKPPISALQGAHERRQRRTRKSARQSGRRRGRPERVA